MKGFKKKIFNAMAILVFAGLTLEMTTVAKAQTIYNLGLSNANNITITGAGYYVFNCFDSTVSPPSLTRVYIDEDLRAAGGKGPIVVSIGGMATGMTWAYDLNLTVPAGNPIHILDSTVSDGHGKLGGRGVGGPFQSGIKALTFTIRMNPLFKVGANGMSDHLHGDTNRTVSQNDTLFFSCDTTVSGSHNVYYYFVCSNGVDTVTTSVGRKTLTFFNPVTGKKEGNLVILDMMNRYPAPSGYIYVALCIGTQLSGVGTDTAEPPNWKALGIPLYIVPDTIARDTVLNAPLVQITSNGTPVHSQTVTLTFDEPAKPAYTTGWQGLGEEYPVGYYTQWQKTYTQNMTVSPVFEDTVANRVNVHLVISGIDTVLHQPSIQILPNGVTNEDKMATLTFDEPAKPDNATAWQGAGTEYPAGYFSKWQKVYTQNTAETLVFEDTVANRVQVSIAVNGIDKVPPVITGITHSPSDATAQPVTITVSAHDDLSGIAGYSINGGAWQLSNQFTVAANGTYSITVTDHAGNYAATTHEVSNITTGIREMEGKHLKMYPNPVHGLLRIETAEPLTHITITDMSGKTVLTHKGSTASEQVDISTLPNGSYVVRIYVKDGYVERKLLKE